MKGNLLRILLLLTLIYTMDSCTSNDSETANVNAQSQIVENYTYNTNELEVLALINDYRVSIGLNTLKKIDHISYKSEEHDNYMITNNVVNHDDFVSRSQNIMKVLGAKTVAENIAYNFNSPQAALAGWLSSPSHKANIEGDFTHFGISIREDSKTGHKYYTNIFAKI